MKGEDIDRYASHFKRARSFVPGVQNEEALFQLQVGLPSYLRLQVNVGKPTTLDAALQHAREWQTAHSTTNLNTPLVPPTSFITDAVPIELNEEISPPHTFSQPTVLLRLFPFQ